KGGMHSLAFVGTPCNVTAVSKMLTSPQGMLRYFMRANIFKIGIFCMDSFSPEALYSFFEREGISLDQVEHMNITKGKFYIHYNGEEKAYPIKLLDKYKASSCNFCLDFTSEDSDISVGSTGSDPGTNTVLIRSELGRDIFEDAVAKGYLEVQPFEKAGLTSVLFLAKLKKVAQYNAKVRNVYIIQQTGATIPPAVQEQDMTVKMGPAEQGGRRRNLISASEKLTEAKDVVKINLANSAGYVLEHLRVRVAKIEDIFETGVWYQDLPDLYPYEGIELDYPLIGEDGSVNMNDIIVEASDQTGRIFNKKVSIAKLLEPKEPSETKADT
ncbi:MAG TPA: Coenzyme F420 hydrogenase/dehydrogenase, beta subunit C-terminal domain, partial [Candidatus Lokiarchaeia archaeon]|nr:Coenzyme F420 hydrogenase/dehydrogenase, beta subunit C-terminal domain [Candidatus Lokiarchaeia archaeon]